jgi:hypothetical protein
MNLVDKILSIYPTLDINEFATTINLQDDSDGRGAYIREWNHPTLARPTDEQLAQLS